MHLIILTEEERKILHSLLLDIPNSKIEELGIDKHTYSLMAHKSIRLANIGKWPSEE
jgi:hypothetical protein